MVAFELCIRFSIEMLNIVCNGSKTSPIYDALSNRNLKFTQTPDYTYLKFLFRGCMKRHHFEEDSVFDWSHYGVNALTPRHKLKENGEEVSTTIFPRRLIKKAELFNKFANLYSNL